MTRILNLLLACILLVLLIFLVFRRPAPRQQVPSVQSSETQATPTPKNISDVTEPFSLSQYSPALKMGPKLEPGGAARDATPAELKAAKIADSSEHTRLQQIRERQAVYVAYGRLLKLLGLKPEEEDILVNLLLDRRSLPGDVNAALPSDTLKSVTDPHQVVRSALKGAEKAIEDDIRQLLGNSFEKFERYEDSLPANLLTIQIQQISAVSGSPLTDTQAERLFTVFQANPSDQKSGIVVPVDIAEGAAFTRDGVHYAMLSPGKWFVDSNGLLSVNYTISDSAWEQASQILSRSQMSALQALMSKQQAERKIAQAFDAIRR